MSEVAPDITEAQRQERAIDRACYRLLTEDDFEAFRLWWEITVNSSVVPPGVAVDPLRLVMAQGDRERLLAIRQRAEAHRRRMKEG